MLLEIFVNYYLKQVIYTPFLFFSGLTQYGTALKSWKKIWMKCKKQFLKNTNSTWINTLSPPANRHFVTVLALAQNFN